MEKQQIGQSLPNQDETKPTKNVTIEHDFALEKELENFTKKQTGKCKPKDTKSSLEQLKKIYLNEKQQKIYDGQKSGKKKTRKPPKQEEVNERSQGENEKEQKNRNLKQKDFVIDQEISANNLVDKMLFTGEITMSDEIPNQQQNMSEDLEEKQPNDISVPVNGSRRIWIVAGLSIFVALGVVLLVIGLTSTCSFGSWSQNCQTQTTNEVSYIVNPEVRFQLQQCDRYDYKFTTEVSSNNQTNEQIYTCVFCVLQAFTDTITFGLTMEIQYDTSSSNSSTTESPYESLWFQSQFSDQQQQQSSNTYPYEINNDTDLDALFDSQNSSDVLPGSSQQPAQVQFPEIVHKILQFSIYKNGSINWVQFPQDIENEVIENIQAVIEAYSPMVDQSLYLTNETQMQVALQKHQRVLQAINQDQNGTTDADLQMNEESSIYQMQAEGDQMKLKNSYAQKKSDNTQSSETTVQRESTFAQGSKLQSSKIKGTTEFTSQNFEPSDTVQTINTDISFKLDQSMEVNWIFTKSTAEDNIDLVKSLQSNNATKNFTLDTFVKYVTNSSEESDDQNATVLDDGNGTVRRLLATTTKKNNTSSGTSNSTSTNSTNSTDDSGTDEVESITLYTIIDKREDIVKMKALTLFKMQAYSEVKFDLTQDPTDTKKKIPVFSMQIGAILIVGQHEGKVPLIQYSNQLPPLPLSFTLSEIQTALNLVKDSFLPTFNMISSRISQNNMLQHLQNNHTQIHSEINSLLSNLTQQYNAMNPTAIINNVVQITEDCVDDLNDQGHLNLLLPNVNLLNNITQKMQSYYNDNYQATLNAFRLFKNETQVRLNTGNEKLQNETTQFVANQQPTIENDLDSMIPADLDAIFQKEMEKTIPIIENIDFIVEGVADYYQIIREDNLELFKGKYEDMASEMLDFYLDNLQAPLYNTYYSQLQGWDSAMSTDASKMGNELSQFGQIDYEAGFTQSLNSFISQKCLNVSEIQSTINSLNTTLTQLESIVDIFLDEDENEECCDSTWFGLGCGKQNPNYEQSLQQKGYIMTLRALFNQAMSVQLQRVINITNNITTAVNGQNNLTQKLIDFKKAHAEFGLTLNDQDYAKIDTQHQIAEMMNNLNSFYNISLMTEVQAQQEKLFKFMGQIDVEISYRVLNASVYSSETECSEALYQQYYDQLLLFKNASNEVVSSIVTFYNEGTEFLATTEIEPLVNANIIIQKGFYRQPVNSQFYTLTSAAKNQWNQLQNLSSTYDITQFLNSSSGAILSSYQQKYQQIVMSMDSICSFKSTFVTQINDFKAEINERIAEITAEEQTNTAINFTEAKTLLQQALTSIYPDFPSIDFCTPKTTIQNRFNELIPILSNYSQLQQPYSVLIEMFNTADQTFSTLNSSAAGLKSKFYTLRKSQQYSDFLTQINQYPEEFITAFKELLKQMMNYQQINIPENVPQLLILQEVSNASQQIDQSITEFQQILFTIYENQMFPSRDLIKQSAFSVLETLSFDVLNVVITAQDIDKQVTQSLNDLTNNLNTFKSDFSTSVSSVVDLNENFQYQDIIDSKTALSAVQNQVTQILFPTFDSSLKELLITVVQNNGVDTINQQQYRALYITNAQILSQSYSKLQNIQNLIKQIVDDVIVTTIEGLDSLELSELNKVKYLGQMFVTHFNQFEQSFNASLVKLEELNQILQGDFSQLFKIHAVLDQTVLGMETSFTEMKQKLLFERESTFNDMTANFKAKFELSETYQIVANIENLLADNFTQTNSIVNGSKTAIQTQLDKLTDTFIEKMNVLKQLKSELTTVQNSVYDNIEKIVENANIISTVTNSIKSMIFTSLKDEVNDVMLAKIIEIGPSIEEILQTDMKTLQNITQRQLPDSLSYLKSSYMANLTTIYQQFSAACTEYQQANTNTSQSLQEFMQTDIFSKFGNLASGALALKNEFVDNSTQESSYELYAKSLLNESFPVYNFTSLVILPYGVFTIEFNLEAWYALDFLVKILNFRDLQASLKFSIGLNMYASFSYGLSKLFSVGVFIDGTIVSGYVEPGIGLQNVVPIQIIDFIAQVEEINRKNELVAYVVVNVGLEALDLEIGLYVEIMMLQIEYQEKEICINLLLAKFCFTLRIPKAIVWKPLRKTLSTQLQSHSKDWEIARVDMFSLKY